MDCNKSTPIRLTLPWPPTVNHYWLPRKKGKGFYVGPEGVRFRAEVMYEAMRQLRPLRSIHGPVAVEIVASHPDRRKRDLDNLFKATLDSLTHAKVYDDDSQIHDLRISWGEQVDGGRLEVTIKEITQ